MLGMNATTGQPLDGVDHLRQSIGDILRTPIGSRVLRREYGSRLPELLDRPMTPELVVDVYAETAVALDRWEPRFRLRRITLATSRDGSAVLDLYGDYRPDGRTIALDGIIIQ